jgi:uncharacterized protein YciI
MAYLYINRNPRPTSRPSGSRRMGDPRAMTDPSTDHDPPPLAPRQAKPTWLFVCHDGPDAAALRVAHLNGHLAHVEAHWRAYVTAGPLRTPGETALSGSAFLVIADTVEAAWALMRGDPYVTCGLYERIEVKEMTMSIGAYPGGKIWESADAIRHRATGG